MSGKLTKSAYEALIAENIAWLREQPKTMERDHIEVVLRDSINQHYPESSRSPVGFYIKNHVEKKAF